MVGKTQLALPERQIKKTLIVNRIFTWFSLNWGAIHFAALSHSLFLLLFTVPLLNFPCGLTSLTTEVSYFYFPFLFHNHLFGSICFWAFIKPRSHLPVPPTIPRHHPFQSLMTSVSLGYQPTWISQALCFPTLLLIFPRFPLEPHFCAWCRGSVLQKSLCVAVWECKSLRA